MVYLIGSRTRPTCKIGFTLREEGARLRELRADYGDNLVVLATLPGARKEEKRLHNLFSERHVEGEWFQMCPEIAAAFGYDINAPNCMWVVHLKYMYKHSAGAIYTDCMEAVIAPTGSEAIVECKRRAALDKEAPEGYCVQELALHITHEEVLAAYALIPASIISSNAIKRLKAISPTINPLYHE